MRLCAGVMALALLAAGCQDGQPLSLASAGLSAEDAAARSRQEGVLCADVEGDSVLIGEMLERINSARAEAGVAPVRLDATLTRIADFYGCRLVEGGFFGHVDPFDGSGVDKRAADFGYAFYKVGENLAAGQDGVEQAMRELMASPGHRANILDSTFTEVGLALKCGGDMGIYWVQEFGRPITAPNPRGLNSAVQLEDAATSRPSAAGLVHEAETTSRPSGGSLGR